MSLSMDLGLVIALLALGTGLVAVLKLPRQLFTPHADPELRARLEVVEQDVAQLRQQLSETQERLDFAERALVRAGDVRRAVQEG